MQRYEYNDGTSQWRTGHVGIATRTARGYASLGVREYFCGAGDRSDVRLDLAAWGGAPCECGRTVVKSAGAYSAAHVRNASREIQVAGRTAPLMRRAKPRVLVTGPLPPPVHGCSVFTDLLLRSTVADEFDLVHVDITDPREVDNIGRLDPGNVRFAAKHGFEFGRLLLSVRPDLAYIPVAQNTWGFLRDALFLTPAALSRTRFVVHFHGDGFGAFRDGAPAPLRMFADSVVSRARAAIVQGERLVPMLLGVIPRERIAVVPNGVPDAFEDVPIRDPGSARRPLTLFLSNLAPSKGYVDLIRSAVRMLTAGIDADFAFAGGIADAPSYEAARQMCRGHEDRIRFIGVADEAVKHELLRSADVLALPSHSEAQPLVILEAMSAALPVVSTRRGAIPETVVDGTTGLLVEPRDIDGLTDALTRLILDPALRLRMGAAGRARYVENYTMDRWADGMSAVFRSVLEHD